MKFQTRAIRKTECSFFGKSARFANPSALSAEGVLRPPTRLLLPPKERSVCQPDRSFRRSSAPSANPTARSANVSMRRPKWDSRGRRWFLFGNDSEQISCETVYDSIDNAGFLQRNLISGDTMLSVVDGIAPWTKPFRGLCLMVPRT